MSHKSEWELRLLEQVLLAGLPRPETEHRFHPTRRWRLDFAWPDVRLAVEIEGGLFVGGRHQHGATFIEDCVKYNIAALYGWLVLRVTPEHVERGYALGWLEAALRMRSSGARTADVGHRLMPPRRSPRRRRP